MKVLIATHNPGKIEGARRAFSHYFDDFEIEGINVPSGVGDEPVNDEIYIGAKTRVKNLKQYAKDNNIEADFYLGSESGITNNLGKWMIVNIGVIEDNNGIEGFGTSPAFPVPYKYVDEIIKTDLGKVMDKLFSEENLAKGKGGVSLLTKDVISRIDQTEEAFVMALTQHINGDLWR